MSTRSILIKDKIVSIINELTTGDNIKALRVYIDNDSTVRKPTETIVFPMQESTTYTYKYENGNQSNRCGSTKFLLGGKTFLSQNTTSKDNDIAFQRYSLLVDKLEVELFSNEVMEIPIPSSSNKIQCTLTLTDTTTNAVANDNEILFNIHLKVDWEII